MSTPFIGEIRIFAGTFAPAGWALCDGSLLPIGDYEALFNLIGTTYGGDGQNTFALPDLRSRVPIHQGSGYVLGEAAGVETVTVTANQLPAHAHVPQASSAAGTSGDPAGNVWAASSNLAQYAGPATATASMAADVLGTTGGSQPHENMLPFLGVNFIISLFGIYPSPS